MRPTQVSLSAAGYSPWIQLDYFQTPFCASVAAICSGTVNLTYNGQYTIDDTFADPGPGSGGVGWYRPVQISQTTTVITVTDAGPPGNGGTHGLSAGDYVRLVGTAGFTAGGVAGNVDGDYNVASVTNATTYTLTSGTSQSFTGGPGSRASSARIWTFSGMSAVVGGTTARTIVSIPGATVAGPVTGVRLYLSAWVSGTCALTVLQGMSK